jgi:hypothetical protein
MTGKNIKIRVGANTLRVYEATVEDVVGEIDETDGESGGYGDCDDSGVRQCDVTLKINWRAADGAPPKAGDLLANVLIAWDGNTVAPVVNKRHLFNYLKVLRVTPTGSTRGKNEITVVAKSSGAFKAPGEA